LYSSPILLNPWPLPSPSEFYLFLGFPPPIPMWFSRFNLWATSSQERFTSVLIFCTFCAPRAFLCPPGPLSVKDSLSTWSVLTPSYIPLLAPVFRGSFFPLRNVIFYAVDLFLFPHTKLVFFEIFFPPPRTLSFSPWDLVDMLPFTSDF